MGWDGEIEESMMDYFSVLLQQKLEANHKKRRIIKGSRDEITSHLCRELSSNFNGDPSGQSKTQSPNFVTSIRRRAERS